MAWDFSTEPEFEDKLAWMRAFVRDEVFPLETLELTYEQLLEVMRPLQERVKAEGLWAAHLPPSLGGMGFGQVRLGLMQGIVRLSGELGLDHDGRFVALRVEWLALAQGDDTAAALS